MIKFIKIDSQCSTDRKNLNKNKTIISLQGLLKYTYLRWEKIKKLLFSVNM